MGKGVSKKGGSNNQRNDLCSVVMKLAACQLMISLDQFLTDIWLFGLRVGSCRQKGIGEGLRVVYRWEGVVVLDNSSIGSARKAWCYI